MPHRLCPQRSFEQVGRINVAQTLLSVLLMLERISPSRYSPTPAGCGADAFFREIAFACRKSPR